MSTVLITRPRRQAGPLKTELERLGFGVLLQPTIEVLPPEHWGAVDAVIQQLARSDAPLFDWYIFFSTNGVEFFSSRVKTLLDPSLIPRLWNAKIAAVGEATEHSLVRRIGRSADLLPEIFSADELAEQLLEEAKQGKRFLVLRASRGRNVLRRRLEAVGGNVTEIAVYRNVDVDKPKPEIVEALRSGWIDFITVTSSAIARSLVRQFGVELTKTNLVSISPLTSHTLDDLGCSPQFEAAEASMRGMVDVFKTLSQALPH